jgi:hypothetical protein
MQNHRERRKLAKQFGMLKQKNALPFSDKIVDETGDEKDRPDSYVGVLKRSIESGRKISQIQRDEQENAYRIASEKREQEQIRFRIEALGMDPDAAADEVIELNDKGAEFARKRAEELERRKARRAERK